jgi:predicted DNA-binding transcriptional regulator AlpA
MQEIGFLSVREVAKILCTTPNAIYIAICEGRSGDTIPPSVKIGGRRLFEKQIVTDWIGNLTIVSEFGGTKCYSK